MSQAKLFEEQLRSSLQDIINAGSESSEGARLQQELLNIANQFSQSDDPFVAKICNQIQTEFAKAN
ncbi:MAG: hypothetical protein ACRCXZ_08150 [Patescibacteria group bacterium]